MMTTDKTLRKADIALDVIIEFDQKNSDTSFRELLDEIILRWKELQ